jgi:Leucine-rich repeat (LRR) protein
MKQKILFLSCLFWSATFAQDIDSVLGFLRDFDNCNYVRLIYLNSERNSEILEKIVDLNLSRNSLCRQYANGLTIGAELDKCPNVQHLNLSNNDLVLLEKRIWQKLGKDIYGLKKLRFLDISGNGIPRMKVDSFKELVEALCHCGKLQMAVFVSSLEKRDLSKEQQSLLLENGFLRTNQVGVWSRGKED